MITKKKLIAHISNFPEEFSIDELIEKLIFVNKLEERIELSKKEQTISENELENEINQWSK